MDISAFVDRFSYLGILLILLLGSIGFPFPEDAILICSGYFIAQKTLSPVPALIMIFAGMLISDLIIFSLGTHYGRRIIDHKWFSKIIPSKSLALIEKRFNSHGTWVILAGRQLFGIRSQVLLMAGIMRMPFLRYLRGEVPAAFVTMCIMITTGYTGGKAFNEIAGKDTMSFALVALIAGVSALILLMRLRMRLRTRFFSNSGETVSRD